jgi:hypothetical protein
MEWLSHDYEDGGVVEMQWTYIPHWSYARQYYWVRLAKKNLDGKSFSKNFKTHNGHIP